jgi:hypothetical protein
MVSSSISTASINGRPPALIFGLNWDIGTLGSPDVVNLPLNHPFNSTGAESAKIVIGKFL